jgi:hypothetical protein
VTNPTDPSKEIERQEFEKFPELRRHIQQLATHGKIIGGHEWNAFLGELNKVCQLASAHLYPSPIGWTKIVEGCDMPAKGERVMAFTEWGSHVVAHIDFRGRWVDSIRGEVLPPVSHWQPLPPIPVDK